MSEPKPQEEKHSLIRQEGEQPALFTSADMDGAVFAEDEQRVLGEYTGERLFQRKPETYRLIVQLLAEGIGQIKIGALLQVSPNTVRAVSAREGHSVDIVKKRLSARCLGVAGLALEGIEEDLSDPLRRRLTSTKDKALVVGILTDKGLLMAGEATSRMEISDITKPSHDDFNAYIAGLKSAATRGDGENPGTKGGGSAGSVIEVPKAGNEGGKSAD